MTTLELLCYSHLGIEQREREITVREKYKSNLFVDSFMLHMNDPVSDSTYEFYDHKWGYQDYVS